MKKRGVKRVFKKRRATNVGRRRRSVTQTSQSAVGKFLPFRSKKISGRRWRNLLWTSTLQKAHYRSNGAFAQTLTTGAIPTNKSVTLIEALDNTVSTFWIGTGGAVALDEGAALPGFEGDIVIRGGKTSISFFNDSALNPVEMEAFYVIPASRPNYFNFPATVNIGWDPSQIVEFSKDIGKIIYRTKFLLEPLATSTIDRRLRVQKIDQGAWTDGTRPKWIVTARDFSGSAVLTTNVVTSSYFNLSFSADAE